MGRGQYLRIKIYALCHISCESSISVCIRERLERCLELCRECSEVCSMGIRFEAQGAITAPFMNELIKMVCSYCADECEKYPRIRELKDCADACRILLQKKN